MVKKRILFVVPSLRIGGTIVSLDSLLSMIPIEQLDVHVFARTRQGEYLNKLPNSTLLSENIWLSTTIVNGSILKKTLHFSLKLLRKLLDKIGFNIIDIYCKLAGNQMKTASYDAIISYQEDLTRIVSNLPAQKRIAWIHCDYSRYFELNNNIDENEYFKTFDKIVCVSESMKEVFLSYITTAKAKTYCLNNVINEEKIRKLSKEDDDIDPMFDHSFFTLVSVGRMDPVKQFDLIPSIAKTIKEHSKKPFKWYIIGGSRGFNTIELQIKKEIESFGLLDNVICLSEKKNVYPYIAKADVLICTSYSEAFPLVTHEAQALYIPVISNNFTSAKESINDGLDGYIIPVNEMGIRLADMLNSGNQLGAIKEKLLLQHYNNEEIIESFIKILNNLD